VDPINPSPRHRRRRCRHRGCRRTSRGWRLWKLRPLAPAPPRQRVECPRTRFRRGRRVRWIHPWRSRRLGRRGPRSRKRRVAAAL